MPVVTLGKIMISLSRTVDEYLAGLPPARQAPVMHLRETIVNNLPDGFEEARRKTPEYIVPFSRYPQGYHAHPGTPLPFMSFANQKNYVALYHLGMYADPELLQWFESEYPRHSRARLDMGKSCVRFHKPEQIPFELIGELARQRSVDDWIAAYSSQLTRKSPERQAARPTL